MTEHRRRILVAIEKATIHHGWATSHAIAAFAAVATPADALALAQELLELCRLGLVRYELPPNTGPTVYALTAEGRKQAA